MRLLLQSVSTIDVRDNLVDAEMAEFAAAIDSAGRLRKLSAGGSRLSGAEVVALRRSRASSRA